MTSQQRMTAEEYRKYIAGDAGLPFTPKAQPDPPKYGNRRTVYKSVQGFERTYDSTKEAAFAMDLDRLIEAKQIRVWLPQVAFPLVGGVTYRSDFMWIDNEGRAKFFDVKGRDTQASINKRKQVKALYGIDVEIV